MKKNSKKTSAYVMSKGLYYNDRMWIFHKKQNSYEKEDEDIQ